MEATPEIQRSPTPVPQRGIPLLALLLVVSGVVLLLQTMDVLTWRLWAELLRYWPVLLIVAGVSILLGRRAPFLSAAIVTIVLAATVTLAAFTVGPREQPPVTARDVNITAAFGSTQRAVTSQEFRGGDVTAAFGSVDLDLRQAGLAQQGGRLSVTAAFGSVDIRVPSDWSIRIEGTSVLGSVEDNRRASTTLPPGAPALVIDATAAFGSVRIRD
jgi:predicted membrane protein